MGGRAQSAAWRRALDAQLGLWRYDRTETGGAILRGKLIGESQGLQPETKRLLRSLYASEDSRLLAADPIFVSGEMCELVAAAADPNLAEPFRPEPLYATDLPTACGFIYFDQPFQVPDRFERPTTIRAVSWSPMVLRDQDDPAMPDDPEEFLREWEESTESFGNGIVVSLYSDLSDEDAATLHEKGIARPPIDHLHMTPWYFGMSFEGNEIDENGVPTGAAWWWRIIQVTFRLMQQRLAVKERERPERHQRREAARYEFPERQILVVRLRRAKGKETEDEHGPANYSHRFIVSGHWRQQWYPASREHRQIWISPYVKGDESLPLVIRPRRAMVWSR